MAAGYRLTNVQAGLLLALGAPCVLVHILDYTGATSSSAYSRDLWCFEMFAGTAGVHKSFRRMGMASAKYDRDIDSDSMDFSTLLGFLVACQYVLRVKANGLLWGGLPCSLHVWISRGTSGKSRDNPRGICNGVFKHDCVRIANLVAARYAMVVLVCLVRQVMWVTEQPASSVAPFLPYLEVALYTARQMLGFPAGLLQKFWMGLFGSRSLKRSALFGSAPYITQFSIQNRVTSEDREKFKWNSAGNTKLSRTKSGRKNVSGGPRLTSTQAYPTKFCNKVASYHKKFCVDPKSFPALPDAYQLKTGPHDFVDSSVWQDAQLDEFVLFLKKEARLGHFQPRPNVPLRCEPLSRDEVSIYFQLVNPTSNKKRGRDD
ncbi:unnamed protein product [Cladocopium goreaui]|uniref:Uncharacterized protein n=1 Tax=Cladocopium goreaui TaxID=2562237 RepID=A0A9P1GJZ1_9DINO|nr:unnamed protein product [Cladocopium goreaui]